MKHKCGTNGNTCVKQVFVNQSINKSHLKSIVVMRKLKITELNRISIEEFKEAEKLPLVVVLDNIRSLHNIGSVFRTSDAFRVECIYLCGITATPALS